MSTKMTLTEIYDSGLAWMNDEIGRPMNEPCYNPSQGSKLQWTKAVS